MVMFYYLGRMVEGVLGSGRLLILYVAGAYAAAFAEYLVSPESTVPVVGASGAVSAVLGAYAIYFANRTEPCGRFLSPETPTVLWLASALICLMLLNTGRAFVRERDCQTVSYRGSRSYLNKK